MTATIYPFPPRRQLAIRVEPEGPAWLVIRGDHGWLFGDCDQGLIEARELSQQDGVGIVMRRIETKEERPMTYDDTNRGALFRATKEKENDRDYSGTLNVNGTEFWVSGWVKTSAAGNKYLSVAIKPKAAEAAKPKPAEKTADDISF